ncbi:MULTISPECIES: DUF6884 domain-containing protein [unclassified Streptomyces]|uniref:DUF6884 domain-containing protein n=1 Tax=unclassified Streptomyces TaxID=2593676 RepID=UPI002D21CB63|nr:DUF6884 domain-containing protein [Streptomyces sp. H-KF8]
MRPDVQESWNPRAFSCGGRKNSADHPVPAGKRYTGSYHLALRRAADALTHNGLIGRVLILSSLHGLIRVDHPIGPYDMRMGDKGSVTTERLRQQAADLGILDADVTVLGPRAYVEASRAEFHLQSPCCSWSCCAWEGSCCGAVAPVLGGGRRYTEARRGELAVRLGRPGGA